MSIRMVRHKYGSNKCWDCIYRNIEVDVSLAPFNSTYRLTGFCHKYNAWITLLEDKEFPISICEE
jgi:hypothetical protein